MQNSTEYVIRPINTGFLVQLRNARYYGGEESAFSTWDEVLEFIRNKPTRFIEETFPSAAESTPTIS